MKRYTTMTGSVYETRETDDGLQARRVSDHPLIGLADALGDDWKPATGARLQEITDGESVLVIYFPDSTFVRTSIVRTVEDVA